MPGNPFYWSAAWRAARAAYLQANPVCQTLGCGRGAVQVDHRRSLARGGHPTDPANLRALCAGCHSAKTARRDGGFGNAPSKRGAGADGRPTSPAHHWNRPRR